MDLNIYDVHKAEKALKTAQDIKWIHRGSKCVRYNTDILKYVDTETDIIALYPDSTRYFVCSVISCGAGEFENVYSEQFDKYLKYGSYNIVAVRYYEWDKVMEKGIMLPM